MSRESIEFMKLFDSDSSRSVIDGEEEDSSYQEIPKDFLDKAIYRGPIVKGDHKRNLVYSARGLDVLKRIPSIVRNTSATEVYQYPDRWRYIFYEEVFKRHPEKGYWSFPPMDSYQGNVLARCITEALNDLNDGSLQSGADLGEGLESIDMMANTAKQIAAALLAAKRGAWGEIPGHLGMNRKDILNGRFPANRWLEYQYGWKPLFGTLHDTYEKSVAPALDKGILVLGKKSNKYEQTQKKHSLSDNSFAELTRIDSAKVHIVARLTTPGLRNASQWGLINPASVAWELVPFSFVVDWFVPIGNVLSAITDTAGLTFVDGYFNTRTKSTFTQTGDSYSEHEYYIDKFSGRPVQKDFIKTPSVYQETEWDFARTPLTGFPTPQYYAKVSPCTLR